MTLPKIGITLGDPGGVGPEVTLKALCSLSSFPPAHYILFGSRMVAERERDALNLSISLPPPKDSKKEYSGYSLSLYNIELPGPSPDKKKPNSTNGKASFLYFEQAVHEAREKNLQAIVTAPVSKRSWELAGIRWAGHTDYLSYYYPGAIMFFWSEKLKVALYTHHIPLKQAIKKVQKKLLFDFFLQLDRSLRRIQSRRHEFMVSGLNPHAGEQGRMGLEEKEEIIPAIESAKKEGLPISGPYPPDVVFRNALNEPEKIVIALYHDQGLIPFKLKAFDQGVNLTLGLPFVRTSPDHGTAFDISGKGLANPQSMVEAIRLAHRFLGLAQEKE
jgi:4-hydroxythreonine-4-phosphate dehydrogenase